MITVIFIILAITNCFHHTFTGKEILYGACILGLLELISGIGFMCIYNLIKDKGE